MAILLEKRLFYFRDFPTTDYDFSGEEKLVLDFLHRWKIRDSIKLNGSVYSEWIIRDADTLRNIAYRLYNSEHFYWIIMMLNDMIDPFYDWPFDESALSSFVVNKYGAENIYKHHHWESEYDDDNFSLPAGEIVSEDYEFNIVSVDNFDYESGVNEDKRHIRLLRPEFLTQIVQEREAILASNFNRR